ncbi:phosphotransferase [Dactylosporangium sp. NPDC049525]|uniref:phosphotransferase enzyme family protein n=1 Tax=Dactylosporangium sp. NPDC049525 TaxID=3154730 RepID=UPI0034249269
MNDPGTRHAADDARRLSGLTAQVRAAYGFRFPADIVLTAGPRGALGQIWRVNDTFALKELFGTPPPQPVLDAELQFSALASAAGVRLPLSHPDHDGQYLHQTLDGTWLRLYDWIDLHPVDLSAPSTPADLGALLARLHRCAPPATPDGEPWYDQVPTADSWPDAPPQFSGRLAERLAELPDLCADIAPADPADLIVCHRDLHPENILADPHGSLVVVDWDNLGPAAPQRELARVLFDWYCPGPTIDLDAMRALYAAYIREGGPGRITDPADFTMLLACRLNFLLAQLRITLNPDADPRHHTWATREIDESLHILPTRPHLTAVLTTLHPSSHP